MKIIAIHQPQYLPWLGYFDKLDQCDVFCLLDTVQYKKNEYQNRNRIKTDKGWQWLTVPVMYRYPQRIGEVETDPRVTWARKHLEALRTHYRKAPFYSLYMGRFHAFYQKKWRSLADLNVECVRLLLDLLELRKEVVSASQLPVSTDDPTLRLVEICRSLGGDTYLSGKDGAKYMDTELFRHHGISLCFQDFHHPVYSQLYGNFEPYMSIVDLLFNCGPESLSILRKARREPIRA